MRKKIIGVAIIATIALAAAWSLQEKAPNAQLSELGQTNVDAMANINPLCPNGCIEGGRECYCYGMHYGEKEYDWGDPK